MVDGFFDGERFQRFAQFVKLLGLLQSNFFAGKTAVRQKGDVAFLHESGERFAHRSAAHTEAFAEFLMMKFLSRHNFIAQNKTLNLIVDASGKIFRNPRFGFRFF